MGAVKQQSAVPPAIYRPTVEYRRLPRPRGGATIAFSNLAPSGQTGRTMSDPPSPGLPPPFEGPSDDRLDSWKEIARVHEAGRDDGATLGEAGSHARAPSRA